MSESASTSNGRFSPHSNNEVSSYDRFTKETDERADKNVTEPVLDTGDAFSISVLHGLSLKKKKLVLHIDLNNTILVSDAVTGQGTVAALEHFLTTVTWGSMNTQGRA